MSEELTLKRGLAAEELLATEAFIVVVNELSNQYYTEITLSETGDTAKREHCFYQIRALQEITGHLQGWINAKVQLLSQTEE
jgi:hypothetical protein